MGIYIVLVFNKNGKKTLFMVMRQEGHQTGSCPQVPVKHFHNVISTCCENVVKGFESLTTSFRTMDTSLFSGHLGAFDVLSHLMFSLK